MGGPGSGRRPGSGKGRSRPIGEIQGKKGVMHRVVQKGGKWSKPKPVSKLKTRRR